MYSEAEQVDIKETLVESAEGRVRRQYCDAETSPDFYD